jgi:erythromycin esterase-like protein
MSDWPTPRCVLVNALRLTLVLISVSRAAIAQVITSPPEASLNATRAVAAAVHDACAKRVVLLGEPPMHGFGSTLELKVDIVRRLVSECHFNAFFIESGSYDFLKIAERLEAHQTVTPAMVAAAIGGLWANREVATLVPFLAEEAQRGHLVLGGLDDQLSAGTYAQREMPADLVANIPDERDRAACLATLQRHMLWQYSAAEPYGPGDRARILSCLDKIEPGITRRHDAMTRDADLAMLQNLRRTFARDFGQGSGVDEAIRIFNDRDRSMYENFKWWMARVPAPAKVLVWTATNHAAKSLVGVPGLERSISLGSYVSAEYGADAFALGFSALSGSYALGRQSPRTLTPAPPNSLEHAVLDRDSTDASYVGLDALKTFGVLPARPVSPDVKEANWSKVFDALVILREERPPRPTPP